MGLLLSSHIYRAVIQILLREHKEKGRTPGPFAFRQKCSQLPLARKEQ
jgi:hypothetical protein